MKSNYTNDNIFLSLIISTLLHFVVLYIVFFGFTISPKNLESEAIITFELLPVSSINNVKTKKIQKEPTIKSDDAKKIEKSVDKQELSEEKPEPKEIKKPEPKEEPKKDAEPLPSDKKEIKKQEIEKKEVKKEEKKPVEDKKKTEKKKKATNDKEIDSLLKNLEKESEGNNKTNKQNREKTKAESDAFGNFDENSPESLTNDELIKQQINRKWNRPIASLTEEIIVVVNLSILIDGTVDHVDISSVICPPGKDVLCSATKDSIIRAITNASPLVNLSPDDYSSWKEIKINFVTKK